jgi:CheY-like chemotaxis protein
MPAGTKEFAESAVSLTKSPLGIIGLFIAFVYGCAALTATFSGNLKDHIDPLIYFLVIFPLIIFIGFLWLVTNHPDKIYGPSDFKNEENFMKMKMAAVASLAAATAKQPDAVNNGESVQQQVNSIVELVSTTTTKGKAVRNEKWKNRILWVDDKPENNIYERDAFESQGFNFSLARSTNEALEILNDNKFAAIISDLARKEGSMEGTILLEKVRKAGDQTPFFIYAGSAALTHKKEIIEKGAQGSTNNPQELFKMVMDRIT